MVVLFEEIGPEGLDVSEELSVGQIDGILEGDGSETGLRAAAPARFDAHLEKVSDKVLVKGRAKLEVKGGCKRCLAETTQSVPVDFLISLVRKPAIHEAGSEDEPKTSRDEEGTGASFDLMATEEETFNGHQIDLGPILREQVLLALPMGLLCDEECKGLCTVCGADLNEGECGCERKPPDPRWAALKNIKLD